MKRALPAVGFWLLVRRHRASSRSSPSTTRSSRRCSSGSGSVLGRLSARTGFDLSNYVAVFERQPFGRNILNSDRRRRLRRRSFARARDHGRLCVRARAFRGRALLLLTILSVSMFPQVAVLSGHVRADPPLRPLQHAAGPDPRQPDADPALHGLGAHDLHARAAAGARGGGVRRRRVALDRREARLPAADGAGRGDHGAPRLHRRVERVSVRPHLHADQREAHRAGRHRADDRRSAYELPWGRSWRPRSSSPCRSSCWCSCSSAGSWLASPPAP